MPSNDEESSTEYELRIERVYTAAANGLRACRGNRVAQLRVCSEYFNRGKEVGISQAELLDFLGVSSPSVLDCAGYTDEEAMRVMEDIALLEVEASGRLTAPTSLPQ